jgi:hypothetical protein
MWCALPEIVAVPQGGLIRLPPPHRIGQKSQNPPPVLPDESISVGKNIYLSERKNL